MSPATSTLAGGQPHAARFLHVRGMAAAALGCTLLTLLAGGLCWGWLAAFGADGGLRAALVCAGPALVTAALAFSSRSDRQQYVLRLMAATAMLPMLLMMWAISEETAATQWSLALSVFGFIVLHLAGFAALVWQLAWLTTRIEASQATPVSADRLGQRLQSLLADQAHWQLAPGGVRHEWLLDHTPPGEGTRLYRVLLNIDPLRCEVQVREREGVSGAAPRSAEEACMRSVGDDTVDAARPTAQRVWSQRLMATIIDPQRVAAEPLQIIGSHAQFPGSIAADSESLLAVLAALVTRSGYAWQPVMMLK
jgi:hypothetical protein